MTKEQIRAQLVLSRHQYQKLMQWKRQCRTTKKPNAKWKTNHL
ncbi:TPA: exonuclease [Escherichia coli]|nr:exonuclease [Shigella dysenteriae]HAJ0207620.1 exonuclease [Escherichia coli]HAJ0456485.1 exonuclease [Escherichia coli]